ncbi:hypothetical protein AAFC00_006881 [Neodothiora populina]|uniref:Uncharacterized protein n=1 Tax=Neodothiora populina TaxID=2781224 RepID=A0ABR3PBH3_9PEZI
MADQTTHHVVNSDRSTGEQSSVDAHANQSSSDAAPAGDHPIAKSTASASASSSTPLSQASSTHPSASSHVASMDKSTPDADSASTNPEQRPVSLPQLAVNGSHDASHSHDDASAGSDTDTSRARSVDQSKEDTSHPRSTSVKKPASFKPVSVTKTFLAKTAGATSVSEPPPRITLAAKSPVAATVQPVAKPRLVAKSGSAMRDLPRLRSGDGAAAPDGRTVWNKNQPVPPPPPKQFTDEELKQQYGIHLASRLQEDEQDGKSKWADEDDDEEDWAPETVEWMDGTKSTVHAAEQQAAEQAQAAQAAQAAHAAQETQGPRAPQAAQGAHSAQDTQSAQPMQSTTPAVEDSSSQARPTLTALKRTALSSSTTKTILRPGAAQQHARQNGTGPQGAGDKHSLVPKSVTAAPVKSPWAPLPPVDKAPPVIINPPSVSQQPQHSSRFGHRDPHGFDSFDNNNNNAHSHMTEPAHEIAADTFDRSTWRDGQRAHRELFNSHSGRYEPVPENRRPSRQHDSVRQPALLQRSSHHTGAQPAEPSAAFQTRHSSQADSSFQSRRRTSSLSGGSAFIRDHRPSDARQLEHRPTFDESADDHAVEHDVDASGTAPDKPSGLAITRPEEQAPPVSLEEEIARQQQVLRESREAAKRRKQEEWEREEAEKKERIRKRLEALAAASAPAQSEQQDSTADQPKPAVQEAKQLEVVEPPVVEAAQIEAQPSRIESQASPLRSSPKKQRLAESSPTPFTQAPTPFARAAPKAPVFEEPQLPGLKQHSPQMSTRTPYQRQPSTQAPAASIPTSTFSSPGDHQAQPLRGMPAMSNLTNPSDSFPIWSSPNIASHTAPGSNVWGPPTNNRHIGNGTFDTGYSRMPSGQLQQHQNAPFSSTPTFGRQYAPRISPQGFGDQRMGPNANIDSRVSETVESPKFNGTSPLPETARPAYQPAPIAPPQKAASRSQNQQPRDTSAWTNFAMQAQQRDRDEVSRLASERRDHGVPQQRWTETYKQTQVEEGWLGGPRKLIGTEQIVHGADAPTSSHSMISPAPPVSQTSISHQIASPGASMGEQRQVPGQSTVRLPTGPSSLTRAFGSPVAAPGAAGRVTPLGAYASGVQSLSPPPMTPTSTPQQSRFFPSALYGGSPPPEEADHPACGGDTRHPHVRLPSAKPKVKLPPAPSPQAKSATAQLPQRNASYRVGAQPLVASQDWQARFNGLFGRAQVTAMTPPSPPRTPPRPQALPPAVAPASKAAVELFDSTRVATTVSLPRTKPLRFEAVSKPGVDDIFDGELSFGSTPRVFLPRAVRTVSYQIGTTSPRTDTRFSKRIEARSRAGLPALLVENAKPEIVRLKLPQAWAIAKEIPVPSRAASSNEDSSRKGPSRPNRNQHAAPAASPSGPSDPMKKPSAPRLTGSRKTSLQKPASTPETQGKPSPKMSGQVAEGEENARKRGSLPKQAKGRGRGAPFKFRA